MSPQIGDIAHFAREDGTGLLGKSWQTVAERDAQRWIGEFIDVAARLEAKVLNRVEMRRFVECRERKSPSASAVAFPRLTATTTRNGVSVTCITVLITQPAFPSGNDVAMTYSPQAMLNRAFLSISMATLLLVDQVQDLVWRHTMNNIRMP